MNFLQEFDKFKFVRNSVVPGEEGFRKVFGRLNALILFHLEQIQPLKLSSRHCLSNVRGRIRNNPIVKA